MDDNGVGQNWFYGIPIAHVDDCSYVVPAAVRLEALSLRINALENAMPEQPSSDPVQRNVEQVIDDLVAGRTTPQQRRGLRSATDRADRVSPSADQAIGRVVGGGS